jgi:hypothetical protein
VSGDSVATVLVPTKLIIAIFDPVLYVFQAHCTAWLIAFNRRLLGYYRKRVAERYACDSLLPGFENPAARLVVVVRKWPSQFYPYQSVVVSAGTLVGKVTTNVVPWPGLDRNVMLPPCSRMIF